MIHRGLLCGKFKRDSETLPPDTRLGFVQQKPDKSSQSHPDFMKDYKNNDKFWNINDTMENIAKKQGNFYIEQHNRCD